MIDRYLLKNLEAALARAPAVVLTGPRQVGKTTLARRVGLGAEIGFYRTTGGAEIDLIVAPKPGEVWAIEIKLTSAPTLGKGFHLGCEDLGPTRRIVVHGGDQSFPLAKGVEAMAVADLGRLF